MKDIIVPISSIVATVIIGLASVFVSWQTLRLNQKNAQKIIFINTVTNSRIKWIDSVISTIMELATNVRLLSSSVVTNLTNEERYKLIRDIELVANKIRLQLNRNFDLHRKVLDIVDEITKVTSATGIDGLEILAENLVIKSQDLLENEWEKVQKESVTGEIAKP